MIEFILAFLYALIITGFAYWPGELLVKLYQIPSKKKIEKWIKSQDWFAYYYNLDIVKDWKNYIIQISTISNIYGHRINFEEINKIQDFLKCKNIRITKNTKQIIILKISW